MSVSPDVPEIDALTEQRYWGPGGHDLVVTFDDAESAIRSALDRQAREIVEYVESLTDNLQSRGSEAGSVGAEVVGVVAAGIRARFAPKEADPR